MTQSQEPAPPVAAPEPRPRLDAPPDSTALPTAADIVSSSREMIQLQGQISRRMEDYNKRPRRTFIGARAKEFRFARYLDDWRLKIERIGELNYPSTARGVYGSLLVTVEIRVDGSLEKVEINRSSGHKALDQAALDIVRLAAPFSPLPPDIARDTDILSITRTWTFTRADRFQAD
jgi:protein TonB